MSAVVSVFLALAPCAMAEPETAPLTLELTPLKSIYARHEGLMMQFRLKARERAPVCLPKDFLSQVQLKLYRAGHGALALGPLIVRDSSMAFQEPTRVRWLEPGQSVTLRANLKRFPLADGALQWPPGEYSAQATFLVCGGGSAQPGLPPERAIPASAPARFLIAD